MTDLPASRHPEQDGSTGSAHGDVLSVPEGVPAAVARRIQRIVGQIAAEDDAPPLVCWLTGPQDADGWSRPGAASPERDAAPDVDVLVLHDLLPHATDPSAALARLSRRSRRHLIITAPREPLAHVGVSLAGRLIGGHRARRYSTPDLLRLASTAGAVRATHLPWLWTVLWVRRT